MFGSRVLPLRSFFCWTPFLFTVMNLYSRKARQPAELYDTESDCRIAACGMHGRFWWWTTSGIRHGSLWRLDTKSGDQRNVASTNVYSQWTWVWSWLRYIAVCSQCKGTQRCSATPCLHIEGRRETHGWVKMGFFFSYRVKKGKAISVQAYYRPRGFQGVEAPKFRDNRHMKVVRSALRTGCLCPKEIFLALISVRVWAAIE